MDGRIDGQFVIKQGGITQGIAKELGLSSAECKQMGSIWNQIVEELNKPNNYTIDNNGKNNQKGNLTVQAGAVVKFTKDCWQKIVDIVNNALGKNIKVAEENTKENNAELGNNLIERFNKEFPNSKSSTYYVALANYLELNNGDKDKINELRENAEKLSVISEQENIDDVPTENRQVMECRHRSEMMTKWLKEQGINDVQEIMICTKDINFEKGEHVFNVIGMAENADTKDPSTWGKNAIVIDAWSGKVFTPKEALKFYKDFFNYDSVDDIQTGTHEDILGLYRQKNTPASYEDMPSQDFANTKDARGLYLDKLNLTEEQLLSLTIDSTTVVSEEQQAILDKAKENTMNPGLNIRSLHEQGVTGKGVRIAIIDSDISDNPEFKDKVISQTNFAQNKDGVYHGNVVSSVAVGTKCGVAPDAELAFYSANTLTEYAKAIEDVITKNEEYRQKGEPTISVISISCGFDADQEDFENNYANLRSIIAKAKEAEIAVITNDPREEYKHFAGADRNPTANPNDKNSYRMDRFRRDGDWWNDKDDEVKDQTIFVPTEHRTVADEYEGYRYEGNFGGDSWGAPYIAGIFALAKQVKPEITYNQFYDIMQKTADKMFNYDTGTYAGRLINPKGIIESLQSMN